MNMPPPALRAAPPPTARLVLRELVAEDARFIVELLNDAGFLRYIGDRGVRSAQDALRYLEDGPIASYRRHGFGLWHVATRDGNQPTGICGLVKRDGLEDVDVGFAFLPRFRGSGYAREAAAASLQFGRDAFGLARIVAITTPDNDASARVLEAIGMHFERMVQLAPGERALRLFATPNA